MSITTASHVRRPRVPPERIAATHPPSFLERLVGSTDQHQVSKATKVPKFLLESRAQVSLQLAPETPRRRDPHPPSLLERLVALRINTKYPSDQGLQVFLRFAYRSRCSGHRRRLATPRRRAHDLVSAAISSDGASAPHTEIVWQLGPVDTWWLQ